MDSTPRVLQGFPITVDDNELARFMGDRKGRAMERLADEIARAKAMVAQLVEPRIVYRWLAVEGADGDDVQLADGYRLEGKRLGYHLHSADYVVLVINTVGPALERRVAELFKEGKNTDALVLDATGSASSYATFQHALSCICQDASSDALTVGRRLRPGVGEWALDGQAHIFNALPAQEIGVTLTDSFMMVPIKSGSAVIPVGSNLAKDAQDTENYCRYCQMVRCHMRQQLAS